MRQEELARLSEHERAGLTHHWPFWARPEQLPPEGDWSIWLVLAGRGFGKTRVGAEWVRSVVCGSTPLAKGHAGRIALVAETAADARDVMVEGESGLLAVHPPDFRPAYEPSKRRLTWPNGASASLFNAIEPDQLRGPQHDLAWSDELAKWRYARETWDQLQFGLRLGQHPRQCVTTTPRPIEVVRELVGRSTRGDGVALTRGKTRDNASNLAGPFLAEIMARYDGTRLGRQELDAEILDDAPGALWTRRMLDETRRNEAPPMRRTLVAIDPGIGDPGTDDVAETGIVCGGLGDDQRAYVLEDASFVASPNEWARRAVSVHDRYEADGFVVEINQGGAMVANTIRSVRPNAKIIEVRATRGKHVRAEPVAALYEQERVSHVGGFAELEDQMVMMTSAGFIGERSPDRLDALVWLLTELFPSVVKKVEPPRKAQTRPMVGSGSWMG